MHTNKQENQRENFKRKPTAPPGPGRPGPGPESRAQTGGVLGLRFMVFPVVLLLFGMHMPLLGWKLILG